MKKWFSKSGIVFGLITGLGFACIMAGFDFYDNKPFNILKFIFHFLFFGLFQSLIFKPIYMKNGSKKDKD
jgi:hypothetical protein